MFLVCCQALPKLPICQRGSLGCVSTSVLGCSGNVQLTFSSVLLSTMTMIAHLSAISVPLTAASNALGAASIFFTIIDAPKPDTTGVHGPEVSLEDNIDLRHINFAYPSRHDIRVLNDFSLQIPAGKTTAIVGPSGSGKSM
jgi:ATP-binding cassette subfamily B (MDR/TAP) protein 1